MEHEFFTGSCDHIFIIGLTLTFAVSQLAIGGF